MRKFILATAAAISLISFGLVTQNATADESAVVRHSKKPRHVCHGPKCGPHAPCGWRCRIACPDGYSCYSLYGAYGPYGGTGFWGAYTYSGWGYRR